jgi:hypothetical protein
VQHGAAERKGLCHQIRGDPQISYYVPGLFHLSNELAVAMHDDNQVYARTLSIQSSARIPHSEYQGRTREKRI